MSEACGATGALVVDGKRVGWLRCDKPAGHLGITVNEHDELDVDATPHSVTLTWHEDEPYIEADEWPDKADPAESFDLTVHVPDPMPASSHVALGGAPYTPPAHEELAASLVGVSDEAAASSLSTCLAKRFQDGAICHQARGHSGDHWVDAPALG